MLSKDFLKMAKKLSFEQANGVAYGEIEGYLSTFSEESNIKEIFISLFTISSETCDSILEALNGYENKSRFGLQGFDVSETYVRVSFTETSESMKNIYAFKDGFYPFLKSLGVLGTNCCSKCKQQINDYDKSYRLIKNRAYAFHSNCAQIILPIKFEEIYDVDEYKEKPESDNNARGVLGALLGGFLGSVPWALVYSLGFISSYAGAFIGYCVLTGYIKLGGKIKAAIIPVVLTTTVFFILFGQFLGLCFASGASVLKVANPNVTLADVPFQLVKLLMTDSGFRQVVIEDFIKTIIFSVIFLTIMLVWRSRRSRAR